MVLLHVVRVFTAASRIVQASPVLNAAAGIIDSRIDFTDTGGTITAIANDHTSKTPWKPEPSTLRGGSPSPLRSTVLGSSSESL